MCQADTKYLKISSDRYFLKNFKVANGTCFSDTCLGFPERSYI